MIGRIINKFYPANNIGNDNVQNREEWLEKTLRTIPDNSKILDAGAGECQYKKYCNHLVYTSQDFAQYTGAGDEKGLQMGHFDVSKIDIVSDITSIPVPDKSFDAVMCIEVIEHVPDPLLALKELTRIIKPGGYLILTAPFCSLTHYSPFHFSTGFNTYFYKYAFKNDFNSVEIVPNGDYYSYLAQELRRLPYIAAKYSDNKPSRLFDIFCSILLHFLSIFKKSDKGSSELLCYGYNVFARKNSDG